MLRERRNFRDPINVEKTAGVHRDNRTGRFQIMKLEERIAPSHCVRCRSNGALHASDRAQGGGLNR